MLVNSPIFIYLFLPFSLGIYALVPKNHKKESLFLFCVLYYLIANYNNPFAVIVLTVTIFFTWAFSGIISALSGKPKKAALGVSVSCLVLGVIAMRLMNDYGYNLNNLGYPFGTAIWSLSAISCLVDSYRGDTEKPGLYAIALHLAYFPVMIAGPLIKFKDSRALFDNINFSMANFAAGARYFMIGFVKRIAVGAVLTEAYQEIVGQFEKEITPFMVLLLAIIVSTDIYTVLSGYSDMGTGISLMYGIRLRENFGNPLTACTPVQYINRFMITLKEYLDDYLVHPITGGKTKGFRALIGSVSASLTILFWYRTDFKVFLVTIPLLILTTLAFRLNLTEKIEKKLWLRTLGRIVTFFAMAVFWLFMRTDNPFDVFGYDLINNISIMDYRNVALLSGASIWKYLIVLIFGIVVLMPATRLGKIIGDRMSRKKSVWINVCLNLCVVILFVITAVFFLPQYPQYATYALRGLLGR